MEKEYNNVILRKAVKEDEKAIFSWRNAPETRKYCFNTSSITWEQHQKWFNSSLRRDDRFILIGEISNKPIGVLRYDVNKDEAEIDIYLVPGLYGKGFGTKLLCAGNDWLRKNIPGVKNLIAKVMDQNIASQKAFKKSGFNNYYSVYKYPITEDAFILKRNTEE